MTERYMERAVGTHTDRKREKSDNEERVSIREGEEVDLRHRQSTRKRE